MIFTKQNGIVVEFSDVELSQTLLRLEASNLRFCLGRDDVAFVNTGSSLMLIDASWQIGRKWLESYLIGYRRRRNLPILYLILPWFGYLHAWPSTRW